MALIGDAKSQVADYRHFIKYSQAQGLSSYNIKKIFKDSKGFLWVATQDGINKFDGVHFLSYTHNSEARLKISGADIREIIEDSVNKKLWIIPTQGDVNSIDINTGNVIDNISIPYENPEGWSLSMALHNNKLWIGSFTGVKIYNIVKGRFEQDLVIAVNGKLKETAFEAGKIFRDAYNNVWVCYCGYGIVIYDGKSQKILNKILLSQLNDHLKSGNIKFNDVLFKNSNEILLATNQGMRSIRFDEKYHIEINNTPFQKDNDLNHQPVEAMCRSKGGELFIGVPGNLYLFNTDLSRVTIIKEASTAGEGNWLNAVHCIYADKSNNIIWIGSQHGISFFKENKPVFSSYYFDELSNTKLEHVRSILPTRGNKVFVGLLNGFAEVDKQNKESAIRDNNTTNYHIYRDGFNVMHISRADGMFIYKDAKIIPIDKKYSEFKAYGKNPINSHLFIGDSLTVLGSENEKGIFLWNYKKHAVSVLDKNSAGVRLASDIVNNIFIDRQKNLWVLSDKVITIIKSNLQECRFIELVDSTSKKPLTFFFDMCQASGYYWIASYSNGIIQLDSSFKIKNIFNSKNGLCNDGIYQVFHVKNNLVVTTNNGLSVFDLKAHAFKNYYEADGLHSNGFEEVTGVMQDGLIYAGGLKGFTIINPELFTNNNAPPILYTDKIVLESTQGKVDSGNLYFKTFSIPNNTLQAIIYFSAINYSNAVRTTYAYRITEKSDDWINQGTQSFVTLIGLSPGKYHLQVKAANEDGIWCEPKELVLQYLPKWYQTWWFKLLVFLIILLGMVAFYNYRISQIRKQHEIRRNIATDLHDDLGSTLSSIKIFTNLAINGVKQQENLQQVKENLQEATLGLRDMIWVLDDSLNTVQELVTRLKQYASPVAEASGIQITIQAASELNNHKVTNEDKRNLFLIGKEAINNSIKYSGASTIGVAISPFGKKVEMVISDNGKGFNVEQIKSGYGLKNMQYRASQINHRLMIASIEGKGTQISIKPF